MAWASASSTSKLPIKLGGSVTLRAMPLTARARLSEDCHGTGPWGQIAMDCVGCSSTAVSERSDLTAQGYSRLRCRDCGKQFNERSGGVLNEDTAHCAR